MEQFIYQTAVIVLVVIAVSFLYITLSKRNSCVEISTEDNRVLSEFNLLCGLLFIFILGFSLGYFIK